MTSTRGARLVDGSTAGLPLHGRTATRALEAKATAEAPAHELMARAGLGLARLLLAACPRGCKAMLLAGPGNNGGDALVAARWLHLLGWDARVVLLASDRRLPSDARWALDSARAAGVRIAEALPTAIEADIAVDGLLGIGASRAPTGRLAEAIALLNRSQAPVVAVDLPTGLDGDRGGLLGPDAVRAAHTLSLLTLKPGLFTAHGRDHAGRIWFDDLGVHAPDSTIHLAGPDLEPGADAAPHASHKGSFGDLSVAPAMPMMAGAATLAASAALGAGAGRVWLHTASTQGRMLEPDRPELMHAPASQLAEPGWLRRRTVLAGCGGGEAIAPMLPAVLAHAPRVVLDADALNALAREPDLQRAVGKRQARGLRTVLTPHPLEAARLLGRSTDAVQADRLGAASELAQRLRAVVVLKGSGTVIASSDGRAWINATGNALLASPGSGDVLAGWLAGRWARAAEAVEPSGLAAAAVWRHGRAADLEARHHPGLPHLLAGELIGAMRRMRHERAEPG